MLKSQLQYKLILNIAMRFKKQYGIFNLYFRVCNNRGWYFMWETTFWNADAEIKIQKSKPFVGFRFGFYLFAQFAVLGCELNAL